MPRGAGIGVQDAGEGGRMIAPLSGKMFERGVASDRMSTRYVFGNEQEYEIEVASSIEQRCRAWTMVYNTYRKKGYAGEDPLALWYGLHDALPRTTTLIA